jgi:hypothetical protein
LNVNFLDFFKDGVDQALADFRMPGGGPVAGATLILAGHSLGGMEAENLGSDPAFASRYHIVRVITFGKPKTRVKLADPQIGRHFLLVDDKVVIWIDRLIFFVAARSPGTVVLPPTDDRSRSEHSNYPEAEPLKSFDAMGDPAGAGHPGQVLSLDMRHRACSSAMNPEVCGRYPLSVRCLPD